MGGVGGVSTTRITAKNGWRYTVDAQLECVSCPTCGMLYAVPSRLVEAARAHPSIGAEGIDIYCPAGHCWGYHASDSPAQKLKREQERAARLTAALDQERASARAYRGAATRARRERDRIGRRVAAGVCPCCNRTFKQLARHMASQHPEFPGDRAE